MPVARLNTPSSRLHIPAPYYYIPASEFSAGSLAEGLLVDPGMYLLHSPVHSIELYDQHTGNKVADFKVAATCEQSTFANYIVLLRPVVMKFPIDDKAVTGNLSIQQIPFDGSLIPVFTAINDSSEHIVAYCRSIDLAIVPYVTNRVKKWNPVSDSERERSFEFSIGGSLNGFLVLSSAVGSGVLMQYQIFNPPMETIMGTIPNTVGWYDIGIAIPSRFRLNMSLGGTITTYPVVDVYLSL